MVDFLNTLVTLVLALLYTIVIGLGAALLVPIPISVLVAVPGICGCALAYHAFTHGNHRELSYATIGLYIAILAMSVGAGLLRATALPTPPTMVAQLLTTLGLSVLVSALYATFSGNVPTVPHRLDGI